MSGKVVRCIYNFPAETDADLDMKIGDVIHVTKEINSDWYEGQIHNRKGQFPTAFVEECNDVFNLAVATRSFSGDQEGDLSFKSGDYVVITEIIDENWMQGYVQGGGFGLFPSVFVKQISLDPSDVTSAFVGKPADDSYGKSVATDDSAVAAADHVADATLDDSTEIATPDDNTEIPSAEPEVLWVDVLENFSAMDSTELDLVAGTKVKILCDVDDFWCKGVTESGKEGIFPRNFVDLPELEDKTEEDPVGKIDDAKSAGLEPIIETKVESAELEPITEAKVKEHESKSTTQTDAEELTRKNINNEIKVIGRTVALFNFSGTDERDLSFNRGDEIQLLEKINENWMKGKLKDNVGIFPSSYVEVVEMYPINETKTLEKDTSLEISKETEDDGGPDDIYENVETIRTVAMKEDQSNTISLSKDVIEDKLMAGSNILKTSPRTESPTERKKKPPQKPGKPQRPKLPDSRKPVEEASSVTYQFKSKSNPLIIIPSKYRKQGSPNVIVLKNWKNEELEEMRRVRGS